jgi:excisionase family DNA binding protein
VEEALLDIEGAARFLGVSTTSLRRWTNAGRLACVRVGGRRERRFRLSDLIAFLEDQPRRPSEQTPARHAADHVSVGGMALPYGTHLCGFYSSDDGRVRLTVAFLAGGIVEGAVCFLVADPPVQKTILTQLGWDQKALQQEIAAGRLVVCNHTASAAAQLERFEKLFVAALAAGAHTLRIVGDIWGLAKQITPEELVQFERDYDEVAMRFPLVTLCLYDVRQFSSLDLLRALRGHGDGFRYPVDRWLA